MIEADLTGLAVTDMKIPGHWGFLILFVGGIPLNLEHQYYLCLLLRNFKIDKDFKENQELLCLK